MSFKPENSDKLIHHQKKHVTISLKPLKHLSLRAKWSTLGPHSIHRSIRLQAFSEPGDIHTVPIGTNEVEKGGKGQTQAIQNTYDTLASFDKSLTRLKC